MGSPSFARVGHFLLRHAIFNDGDLFRLFFHGLLAGPAELWLALTPAEALNKGLCAQRTAFPSPAFEPWYERF